VTSAAPLPAVPPGLWGYRITRDLHLIGGATSEGGNVFRWARETLRIADLALGEAEIASRPADAHGLTFLPLLAGERSPGWWADATGAVHGLRLSTSPIDLLHAALEGVALRLAAIADQLGAPHADVMGSGGALSPLWAQIIADALDRPVHVLPDENAVTARGTAILTLKALEIAELTSFPVLSPDVQTPRPEHVERLRAARERQAALYRLLIPDGQVREL
jgi:gluconokinase